MGDDDQIDRCPFCNAPWGICAHIKILLEWEKEALARESRDELGNDGVSQNREQAIKSGLDH